MVFVVVVAVAAAAVVFVTSHLLFTELARRNCSPAVHLYVFLQLHALIARNL